MTIETKFSIGEYVYLLHNNRAYNGIILAIQSHIQEDKQEVSYFVNIHATKSHDRYRELDIYKTKEELIQRVIMFV